MSGRPAPSPGGTKPVGDGSSGAIPVSAWPRDGAEDEESKTGHFHQPEAGAARATEFELDWGWGASASRSRGGRIPMARRFQEAGPDAIL